MPKVNVYDLQGKPVGEYEVSEKLLAGKNTTLHRTVVAQLAHLRQGTHDTLTRGEVRGGGRKPWPQKHTGRARQGSIRAPHWRHGGVVHGPTPRDYNPIVNKKERRAAIRAALADKIESGALRVVEDLQFPEIKTKHAAAFLKALGVENGRVLILLHEPNEVVYKSFRNLPNVLVRIAPAFALHELIPARTVIATRAAVQKMEEVWAR
ncbi:MAG: 50S ribosomal protein L4 [Fimbriimonadales bacterium]|jgi:large subunit ribosomal protein L4|nr:50S ribosomal protein L4 [Armatimonadota bacterium]MCX7687751.1 50S ribosomal protein L4 [Fimbriimonadales bacterium]CUU37690.1 large subunit ribosomal protein L4 [Armatimonadetes bacterium DC]CUU38860.1 large subunit ribosomal protein L4 [Armatimonadetes bacterium GXS]GBC90627.1 50S ribosomal protein L4 [bacterium HR14]